ncbi:MAG TPA: hypothetical protein VFG20_18150 [Planctomycetaceae bacterium]|jgi:type II secretory pathway component PulK|nr:hypothetical protein [Planctomycetaceae bacterium]
MRRPRQTATAEARHGGALIVVIIALAVASMIGATLLQMAFTQRRQQQHDRLRVQAGWLAEAGLQRGLLQARRSAEYRGETWTIEVPGRGTPQTAEVEISVTEETPRIVTAVATYPTKTAFRARIRNAAPLETPTP